MLSSKLPLFIGIVVLLSALLLLVVFRSLVIPVQAAVMNLLSIGASLGVVVAIFQWGWLGSFFNVKGGPIEAFIPVMLFAIVFGLSMDYEVFLVSRIHEEWGRRKNASYAVNRGLASTGRVITAAAAIMICVFASFALGDERVLKLFGLSLATAVFLNAFVVRSLLLPWYCNCSAGALGTSPPGWRAACRNWPSTARRRARAGRSGRASRRWRQAREHRGRRVPRSTEMTIRRVGARLPARRPGDERPDRATSPGVRGAKSQAPSLRRYPGSGTFLATQVPTSGSSYSPRWHSQMPW